VHTSTVFVDESGDLGFGSGSSRYITIGALITDCPDDVRRIPLHIRKRKLKKRLRQKPELEFHNSCPELRKSVLGMVMALQGVSIASVTVDKRSMPWHLRRSPERFYEEVCGELLSAAIVARGGRGSYRIVFDARPHNRPPSYGFEEGVREIIEESLFRVGLLPVRIDISVIDSHNSGGLQVADFIVGAVQRKNERGDPTYYDIIAPAMLLEKKLY